MTRHRLSTLSRHREGIDSKAIRSGRSIHDRYSQHRLGQPAHIDQQRDLRVGGGVARIFMAHGRRQNSSRHPERLRLHTRGRQLATGRLPMRLA